ncbi:hypothetical protein SanaruYs_19760 [Chryseotalea sanaruensis]|uniref:Addiction module toxin RelE n=1 Tax=Chryseotalea sanaruensis TaxID=2482724 RepID=A0A401UA42_9BACT|nr:hypothetical protein [Chryseotalea sanaruensis]GCC51747.1 hypothetical protein SanaruYs_19760 [Chryseotalea sanaruensis]
MKRIICIELFEQHKKATFYTLRFQDEELSEFDKFFNKFDSQSDFDSEMDTIASWLEIIGREGVLERHFRPEGDKRVKAIPINLGKKLRLYCFRIDDIFLLIGGGGIKHVRRFQDDSDLEEMVRIVRKAGNKLLRYYDQGKIKKEQNNTLSGKLTFTIDL